MSGASWGGFRAEGSPGSLARTLRGFSLQRRVVSALLLREMQTRFGRNQLGFLWLFLEPLLLASAISGIKYWSGVGRTIPGVSIFIYSLIGYLPYFTFRAIVSRAPGTLRSNMSLLYHAQIKMLDVVLARHALEAGAVVTVMTLIVVAVAIWADLPPHSIPVLVVALVLLVLLANGLGLLAAAAAARWEMAEKLIHPLTYISLPLSGALISLHAMDPAIREILLWNPQANIHEMVREGFFGDRWPCYFDVGYVLFCVGIFNLLGLAALRAVRPRLEF